MEDRTGCYGGEQGEGVADAVVGGAGGWDGGSGTGPPYWTICRPSRGCNSQLGRMRGVSSVEVDRGEREAGKITTVVTLGGAPIESHEHSKWELLGGPVMRSQYRGVH